MMAKLYRYRSVISVMVLICCSFCTTVCAQKNYRLIVQYIDSGSAFARNKSDIQTTFNNKSECDAYVFKLPALLHSRGFIAASVDSFFYADNQSVVSVFLGLQYHSVQLVFRLQDGPMLQQVRGDKENKKNNIYNFSDYNGLTEKLLDYFEETGYPFAKINLDSVTIAGDQIRGLLKIDKGPYYHIDSLRMYGSAKVSRNFIHHYLNIERGSAFNKKKLDKINQRLLELPYLQQTNPWDMSMLNSGSIVNLYLKPRRSNQVNILAGFLPASQQLGGKLLFTIDANMRLQNAFSSGETLGLVWQQIQPKSPRLNLQFTQPFIFNSPIGIDFLFDLFKKDSAFLNVNAQMGLVYMLSPVQTGKLILQTRRSNILDVDTNFVKANKRLPDVADVSSVNIGIDYEYANTDYKFNPRKGNELYMAALAGNKTISKSNAISQLKDNNFDYNTLYDTIKLKTYQLRFTLKGAKYFKAGKQSVIKTALNTGLYQSPQYFRNDLFQVGGYKLLRGFDEESIYADKYAIATLEYRYLLSLNSNFFVFSDFGWSSNSIIKQSNNYLGAGLGLSFETKGGIFNLSYAAGKRNDLNFDIRQSKIHFGFVSIF